MNADSSGDILRLLYVSLLCGAIHPMLRLQLGGIDVLESQRLERQYAEEALGLREVLRGLVACDHVGDDSRTLQLGRVGRSETRERAKDARASRRGCHQRSKEARDGDQDVRQKGDACTTRARPRENSMCH